MVEALEELLPLPDYDGNPFKVADLLNVKYREGDIELLGGGRVMVPSPMLRIAAYAPPVGKAVLYVEVSGGPIDWIDNSPYWQPNGPLEQLERHHQFWTFGRAGFEKHFSDAPKNRGGHPRKYKYDEILIEVAVAVYEEGLPEPLTLEGFANMVGIRLGDRSPKDTQLKEILRPLYQRLKKAASER